MPAFPTYTLDEITQILADDFRNRFPGADVSTSSNNWKRLRTEAIGVFFAQGHIDAVRNALLPDSATEEELDRWGAILNLPRKQATAASGTDVLRVTGSATSSVTAGDVLTHSDGSTYQVDESDTIGAGETYIDVDIVALTTGSLTRKIKGEELTFASPPSGIDATATLIDDMTTGGVDREDDGAYRERLLDKIAQPGMGGNSNDYVAWARQVSGVSEAYTYPVRDGLGSVDVAALHSGTGAERLLSTVEIAELQTYMDGKRPVSINQFRVLTVAEDAQDVEITIEQEDDATYNRDWDDSTALTVDSWDAGTRTLTLVEDVPDDMIEGARLIYKGAANAAFELEVESLSGAKDVVLAQPASAAYQTDLTDNPPVNLDEVYSGGPLVAPVRTAIQSYVDGLGPARGTTADGTWDDVLRTIRLRAAPIDVLGVKDATVVAPVSNVTPADNEPADTVDLVTLRQILVRYE